MKKIEPWRVGITVEFLVRLAAYCPFLGFLNELRFLKAKVVFQSPGQDHVSQRFADVPVDYVYSLDPSHSDVAGSYAWYWPLVCRDGHAFFLQFYFVKILTFFLNE